MKHKTTILAALAGCILLPSSLSAYEPAGDGLITRWGKEVTPENAWRSYPRPRLERSQWLNLNGIWNCSVTPSSADITDAAFDREILVPFCIESSLRMTGSGTRGSSPWTLHGKAGTSYSISGLSTISVKCL